MLGLTNKVEYVSEVEDSNNEQEEEEEKSYNQGDGKNNFGLWNY
jgi:hypothetical protein